MLDYKLIGERIRQERKAKKISQCKLAKELGVCVAYMSRIEKGSSQLSLKRLNQICSILDISEGAILNGTDEKLDNYLEKDMQELLNKATDEQKKLVYKVVKTIIEN